MTSQKRSGAAAPDPVRYVVVAHGMGHHRPGESLPAVIGRSAEARRGREDRRGSDPVTLGMAVRGDEPWVELDGIPQRRPGAGEVLPPFVGRRSRSGRNLRFVDLHWADVLDDEEFQRQDLDGWVTGLIARLERKDEAVEDGSRSVPPWIMRVLYRLQETVVLVRKATAWRSKEADELIFDRILGDVQVYGEYATCRGRAVRRFHECLAEVDRRHRELHGEREARYVVIAHSLGSVLALDALLYAHAREEVRRRAANGDELGGLPFDGYAEAGSGGRREASVLATPARAASGAAAGGGGGTRGLPDLGWLPRVQSLVTLGSPIDKFLTVWWLRYRYLETVEAWLDPEARGGAGPILHFNYCEEQDPVGHELDLTAATAAYGAIFEKKEDRVYLRSARPGIAHSAYWKDTGLFARILERAVDLYEPPEESGPGLLRRVADGAALLFLVWQRLAQGAERRHGVAWSVAGDLTTLGAVATAGWAGRAGLAGRSGPAGWLRGLVDRLSGGAEPSADVSFAIAVVAVVAAAALTYTALRFYLVKLELRAAGGPREIARFADYVER